MNTGRVVTLASSVLYLLACTGESPRDEASLERAGPELILVENFFEELKAKVGN